MHVCMHTTLVYYTHPRVSCIAMTRGVCMHNMRSSRNPMYAYYVASNLSYIMTAGCS